MTPDKPHALSAFDVADLQIKYAEVKQLLGEVNKKLLASIFRQQALEQLLNEAHIDFVTMIHKV